jgi:hypothetical protein
VFSKTIILSEDLLGWQAWDKEMLLLNFVCPFQISNTCGFGDKLIGCIDTVESNDFYIEIFKHYKWIV